MIRKNYPDVIISVDTFRHSIAEKVVKNFEVDMINDISAGELDEKMFETVADLKVPYIIMHMKGTPQNMKEMNRYTDMMGEIIYYFSEKYARLKKMGVPDIIIDPGFGFAKDIKQNFELLKNLDSFKVFELPLLVGLSRKSMIYKSLGTSPDEALTGTIGLNMLALEKGADVLRVHDVKQAKEVIQLFQHYNKSETVN
jgi:dihydropteroate synthase